MERVAAMPDASLYVNRDGRRADDCVDSHGGGNLTKIPNPVVATAKNLQLWQNVPLPHIAGGFLDHQGCPEEAVIAAKEGSANLVRLRQPCQDSH